MRSLFTLLIVLVICGVGLGFYLGWFSISKPNPGAQGDKVNMNVTVDKAKIQSDVKNAEEKVKNIGEKAKEEIKDLEGKAKAKVNPESK
jgi:hypothetical protein